jgi:hypothetical protein
MPDEPLLDDDTYDPEGPGAEDADLLDDDGSAETEPCPFCGAEIYAEADQCPVCRQWIVRD